MPFLIVISIILICYTVRSVVKGMYSVLTARYLTNFTDSESVTKVLATNSIAISIGRASVNFIGAQLLLFMPIQYAMLWVGFSFSILILIIFGMIKNKVGMAIPNDKHYDLVTE